MKKFSIAKIASLIFVCVMLFAALTVTAFADETAENIVPSDVFTSKGYSIGPDGEPCFGFTLDLEAKEAYETQTGKTAQIGIVIAILDNLDGNPFDAEGNPANGVVTIPLNGKNTSFNFKLVNFTDALKERKYVIAPYLYDGSNVYYYENGEMSETVAGVSYSDMIHTHTVETVEGTAATCTDAGMTDGKVCSECGEVLEAQVEIPALGHANEDGNYVCDNGCGKLYLPAADEALSIPQANEIASLHAHDKYTADKYYVTGVITKILNTEYGNVYIEDEDGNEFYIYGLYTYDGETKYDAMTYKPVVSDEITVWGVIGRYNDYLQMKNGWIDEVVRHTCDYSDATCAAPATCKICGATTGETADHTYENGVCTVCGATQGLTIVDTKYVISSYPAGTQYAKNEEHVLDDFTVMYTNDAHFTSELRLYSSSTNNGYAIIQSVNAISKIAVNAGNKVDVLVIYGSNDEGATWTEAAQISVTSTSYKDYSVELNDNYKWIKIDVKGTNQVRIKNFTLTTLSCNHLSTEVETTEATCTENGYEFSVCTACGAVVGDKVKIEDAHHNYTSEVTDPTCLDDGFTTFTCTACGDTYTEAGAEALGHTYTDGACIRCGLAEEHVHNYEEDVTDPTCTEKGYTTYTCSCNESYVDNYVDALGHADSDANYKCDACSTRMVPEADSTLTIAQAIALGKTFTKDSYTTNKYYITGTITLVDNTTFGNVYITDGVNSILVYGLYSADGTVRYDALTAKPVKGDEITVYGIIGYYTDAQMKNGWIDDFVAHTCDIEDIVTDPTCTADGYTTHKCTLCDKKTVDTEVPALGHTTENGTCERCGKEIGDNAPVLTDKSYSYTFTAKQFSANGTKTLGDVKWTLAGEGGYWGYDATKGQQFGSGSKPYKTMTLTSDEFTNVSKITINTSGASSINGTFTITVGGVEVASNVKLTSSAATYTYDVDGLSGPIVISYTQSSSKAIYIKSISVDYAVEE